MRVFVTGGTGAVGGYAVPALIAAGHLVSALARTDDKARVLREQGATPVAVSLFDRWSLSTAFAGHDIVVNLASALPSPQRFVLKSAWAECQRVRTEGSATVVDAALDAGVSRVVQESVAMIYRDGADRWLDEDWPTDHYPIAAGNHAAEANARRFGETGCTAVVLRFGIFYGHGAAHSEQIMAMARRHIGFRAGDPRGYVSSIHLADAATAVVAALDCAGGVYNVVDDAPVNGRDNALAMADAVGAKPWIHTPGRLALLLGDRTTSMTRSLRVSNARFRSATTWKPRFPSVREGYRAMAKARN
ncbi:NAD(P)-dependent oxidoreductase [Mycobacterium colombiense]|uniref:NAD-dependent epimerase/dehydratase n=1 Tax=Mycobacterium colombiense CECT 3035 TaxID=1041522 RepID=J5EGC1_9MYCO|nr:NAD(P)H-binding protein [Mycobacterium colombiense]EJO90216.1 NAD-dependent epimerase/dehydratase [Mycobacterium colombiense CECT 3035]